MAAILVPGQASTHADSEALFSLLTAFGILLGTRIAEFPADAPGFNSDLPLAAIEQERLLTALDPFLADLGLVEPLRYRDLLQLFRHDLASEEHLTRFGRFHVHEDDEGRYVLNGSCVFGLALPRRGQLRLHLGVGDYLRLPAGIEHWFAVPEGGRLLAVRLFSGSTVMATTYTNRPIQPLSSLA